MYYGEIWMVHKSALEDRTPIMFQEKTTQKSRAWAVSFRSGLFENFKKNNDPQIGREPGRQKGVACKNGVEQRMLKKSNFVGILRLGRLRLRLGTALRGGCVADARQGAR